MFVTNNKCPNPSIEVQVADIKEKSILTENRHHRKYEMNKGSYLLPMFVNNNKNIHDNQSSESLSSKESKENMHMQKLPNSCERPERETRFVKRLI